MLEISPKAVNLHTYFVIIEKPKDKMKRLSIISILLLALAVFACKPAYQSALEKIELGEYNTAIPMLESALAKANQEHEKGKIHFYIGECYRMSNRLPEAVDHYEKALANKHYEDKLAFYYGYALKATGKYEEAKKQFSGFTKTGSDYALVQRAKKEILNMPAVDSLSQPNEYVTLTNLEGVNTDAAEYSPTMYKDKLVFSSTRRKEKVFESTGGGFADLYMFEFEDKEKGTGTATPFNKSINTDGFHEASAAFSKDGMTMVFARSNSGAKGEKDIVDVNLFISKFEDGDWSAPKLLTDVTQTKSWDGCPAFSADGKTLYFASDRSGGYGGIDLYSSKMNDRGDWGRPRNMGRTINTPGNEMFPYVSEEGKLYFSSDGHPGLGGLDLFEAERAAGVITIKNLGAPYNSSSDDFGMIATGEKTGYFVSNRASDNAKGDDDIYAFIDKTPEIKIIHYFLEGITYQKAENGSTTELPDVKLQLKDANGEVIDETVSGPNGKFKFTKEIAIDADFEIEGIKNPEHFYKGTTVFSSKGKAVDPESFEEKEKDFTFSTEVTLGEIPKVIEVLEKTGEASFEILYDLDKFDIRPDAATILDKVVEYMQNNDHVFELGSHTDAQGDFDYNQELSEKRAKAAVDYIVSKGIAPERLVAKGYGETDLKIKNARTPQEHQENRRTTLKKLDSKKQKHHKDKHKKDKNEKDDDE